MVTYFHQTPTPTGKKDSTLFSDGLFLWLCLSFSLGSVPFSLYPYSNSKLKDLEIIRYFCTT